MLADAPLGDVQGVLPRGLDGVGEGEGVVTAWNDDGFVVCRGVRVVVVVLVLAA